MRISVIIPTYEEEKTIGRLIRELQQFGGSQLHEILVVDWPGSDQTAQRAREAGATVLTANKAGRAIQMNCGAKAATGDVLYFVHADVGIHLEFVQDIQQALSENFTLGCYRYKFDSDKTLLKFNAFCTRFDRIWCRGGDQTLFITRTAFESLGGFREDHLVMEDYEFILRARRKYQFRIIPKEVVVSARKYEFNSYLRVNLANAVAFVLYFSGAPQAQIIKTYKSIIRTEKYGVSGEKSASFRTAK
ncbi:TIGR04283 family arsenosugar biosynthesis glycosyltransferase [Arundinibacter roseus]|uniref:Glycosyltransferase n=1 Tax=Arundinibacter roseus TaxID=2070510 RepID=A0A4R4KKQ0_9BACT|nr:TIGR04283 family arsenosugar biosynthesis glycosyltransferase [Arundinibacter roseus]TDB68847.1 glycosyltransferase [Arundinibacter roseus]